METLRTSSYMIPVKLEKEKGKYMLIHGYTGAIDIVSEELLSKINSISKDNNLTESTLQNLVKRGYITTKSAEEEYAYIARMAKALHRKNEILHTDFTWVITYNCNFRCPYCYEGREKKDSKHLFAFTKNKVDEAYQALEIIQPCKELRKNIITLYGGEPLLKENKEIVSYIVEKGISLGYKFWAVTNGYDLDTYLDLLSPEAICELQITIDGPKEMHDQRRIHYKHKNTFDKIITNIHLALKRGIKISVRMNSDNYNVEKIHTLKDLLNDLGFSSYPNFKFYSAVIKDNMAITSSEYNSLDLLSAKTYIDKNKQYNTISICQDYGVYDLISKAILEKSPILFRSTFCASQFGGYVLDPFGDIYPCWEVVGKREERIGSYYSNKIIWDNETLEKWRNVDISVKSPCNHCRYAFFCGGGCPVHSRTNKYKHCAFFQKIFEVATNRAYANLT